jgi:PAS domain S-box-containing protein
VVSAQSTTSDRTPRSAEAPRAVRGKKDAAAIFIAPFLSRTSPSTSVGLLVVAVLIMVETAVVYVLHKLSPTEHLGAVYLLGVLVAAAFWPLGVAVVAAIGSAIAFDWVRSWPAEHFLGVEFRHLVMHATLLVVAVCANALAQLARARTDEADQRRHEADLSAELAHLTLRADDLDALLAEAAERLAHVLNLPSASLNRGRVHATGGTHAVFLYNGDRVLATLLVPRDVPRRTMHRLCKRVVPALEAMLRVACDREATASALQASHQELERFFGLSSDLLCIGGRTHYLHVNPAFERVLGYSRRELVTWPLLEFVLPEDRPTTQDALAAAAKGSRTSRFENRLRRKDGSERWLEWSVRAHRGLFYAAGRDVTERRREQDRLAAAQQTIEASNAKLADLAARQSALRRTATLIARGVPPRVVFNTVIEEIVRCLEVPGAVVIRNQPGGEPVQVAGLGVTGTDDSLQVQAPIIVDDQPWGTVAVAASQSDQLADTQTRLEDFADLVAIAIANATARTELRASRARIVTAADNARRRLERDLHDGAQQRLETLKLEVRMAHDDVPAELHGLRDQTARIMAELTSVSDELHEFSRGIHPAVLDSGLSAALRTLARRSSIPVTLDASVEDPLPDSVQVAAYYVVSEALANTAKHARAEKVTATAHVQNGYLHITVEDDGVGGADPRKGSGLVGLVDRVEALGGRLRVTSPTGQGTSLHVELPLQPAERHVVRRCDDALY